MPARLKRSASAIVQGDQIGDTGWSLPALDLDDDMVVHAQPIGWDVLDLRDPGAAS